jgi:energy-coupling factor transporter ATP-binding protein EcfA2
MLNGMLRPTSGKVFVEGRNCSDYTIAELGKIVGYVFQNPDYQLFTDSVENEVVFGLKNMGLPEQEVQTRLDEALDALSIVHYRKVHPRRLSYGERQRVAIASIVAMKPKAIILDEPTAGQDSGKRQEIRRVLKSLNDLGLLVIVVSHDLGYVASCCQRIIALDEGQIVADDLAHKVLTNSAVLERIRFKSSPMMQLAAMLRKYGCEQGFLTVDEMALFVERKNNHEAKN